MSKYPVIIGRFEYIDVIDALTAIPAKMDTGANRSSIHATNIKEVTQNGKKLLKFSLLGHPAHPESYNLSTNEYTQIEVKSSNGHVTKRYEVKLKIKLGYKIFIASFTLADRSGNVFPVLVGREALRKRFIIDPDRAGVKRSEIKFALDKASNKEEIEGVNV